MYDGANPAGGGTRAGTRCFDANGPHRRFRVYPNPQMKAIAVPGDQQIKILEVIIPVTHLYGLLPVSTKAHSWPSTSTCTTTTTAGIGTAI